MEHIISKDSSTGTAGTQINQILLIFCEKEADILFSR